MTEATETVVVAETKPAAPKVRTLADVQARVLELAQAQAGSEINVVSAEITQNKHGKRVELILSGAGVGDPTRRYFLRENSAFASGVRGTEGLVMFAPKKARGAETYQLNFGLSESATQWMPEPPAKAEKVLLTPEERKARRMEGKAAAKAKREAEAAAAAAATAEASSETESDDSADTGLDSGEPVVISQTETAAA